MLNLFQHLFIRYKDVKRQSCEAIIENLFPLSGEGLRERVNLEGRKLRKYEGKLLTLPDVKRSVCHASIGNKSLNNLTKLSINENRLPSCPRCLCSSEPSSPTPHPELRPTFSHTGANEKIDAFPLYSSMKKKAAFTLAEVLITLGIIGVVAAMTLSSLINNVKNKGYVEGLKKAYSILQSATNDIVNDMGGPPSTWIPDAYKIAQTDGYEAAKDAQKTVINMYVSKMKVVQVCDRYFFNKTEACVPEMSAYKKLNNKTITETWDIPYQFAYPIQLANGMNIGFRFMSNDSGGVLWGEPPIRFTVDVNGKAKPNKVGRDIFYLYLNNEGKVLPYGDGIYGNDHKDDCNTSDMGASCAYKVLMEDAMNY